MWDYWWANIWIGRQSYWERSRLPLSVIRDLIQCTYRVCFIDKALVIVPADILVYKLPVGRVRNKLNVQYLCLRSAVIWTLSLLVLRPPHIWSHPTPAQTPHIMIWAVQFWFASMCIPFFQLRISSFVLFYFVWHPNSSLLYYTILQLSWWKFLFYMWIIAQSSDHSSSIIWRCCICFVCVVIGLAKLNKLFQSDSKCYFQVQLKPFLRNFDFRWSEKLFAL